MTLKATGQADIFEELAVRTCWPYRYQAGRNSTHLLSQTESSCVHTAPWPIKFPCFMAYLMKMHWFLKVLGCIHMVGYTYWE